MTSQETHQRIQTVFLTTCVGAFLVAATACTTIDQSAVESSTTVDRPPTTTSMAGAPGDTSGPFLVTKVVDGDTLWVQRGGQVVKLRLIGIDTPETRDPRKPVQCFGREASAAAETMVAGRQVLLESDPSQGAVDRYGRELVYVWVDGELLNLQMIQGGFAHEYTYDVPYRYQSLFKAAQQEAEQAGVGLWAAGTCAGDTSKAAGG